MSVPTVGSTTSDAIPQGRTALGIELGSTRIKACLVDLDAPAVVLATGTHEWENSYVDGTWTYDLDEVWRGVQAAYRALADAAERDHGTRPRTLGAIGVSAMMHGYLAFDSAGELLVPFRTWRNTSTGPAAAALTEAFGVNIPLRWSVAHHYQAILDHEAHVAEIAELTTLAGHVHRRLTGRHVLGIGDASGMFPIDDATRGYHPAMLARYAELVGERAPRRLEDLLPEVLAAGDPAGELTEDGARLLDPSGTLRPGAACCPPEGDAGTGMVATGAVAPRTGNVSAGTSIFAMVVLEGPLEQVHHEIDLVATPAGDPVAMVHCNNGASELGAWARMFGRFAEAAGCPLPPDQVYDVLFREAISSPPDAGGVVSYNHLAGEPVAGLEAGRPLVVRTPDSELTLASFVRSQLYGVFGTLSLGLEVLAGEGVGLDEMFAHGGLFRTAGVAQRMLAAALDTPVAVGDQAAEGGAWGMAVLAAYLGRSGATAGGGLQGGAPGVRLGDYLADVVFADAETAVVEPDAEDVAGYATYLERYRAGLAVERAAAEHLHR